MKYRVIFQPRALRDLEDQYRYIEQQNPAAATRWFNRFVTAIDSLAEFPERCSVARETDTVGKEIRQLLFGKGRGVRRALFAIEGETVRVLCIRHIAQQDTSAGELLGDI